MYFFIGWFVCFLVFFALTSFFRTRYKLFVSLACGLIVSLLIQVLEQFYLSSIVIVAFILYFIISNMNLFRNEQLKLMIAALFSTSIVTVVLSFTYFNQTSAPSDAEVLRVMFIYYPILILFIACYTYMLLGLFRFKILQVANPFLYILDQLRGLRRLLRLISSASRQGLNHLIQQDNAKLPYAIAAVLEQMGGVFVKFAQVLSTKKDMLPGSYIEAFSNLHDNVQPLSQKELTDLLHSRMDNMDEYYETFDMQPIAAASIGQVHLAKLKSTGEQVVVKLLRPDVKQKITVDLHLLIQFVTWLSERSDKIKKIGLVQLAEGFKQNLLEETDFEIEALNTNLLRKAFQEHGIPIHVPQVYPEYSTKYMMTMEYIEGSSFTQQVPNEVSVMIMHAFLDQILTIGIFHADPHPGNLLLLPSGEVALIDFGSVGYLTDEERDGMLHFLIGYSNKDTRAMTQGLMMVCEPDQALDEMVVQQRLNRLLLEASFSADPTSIMMKRLMLMITEMGLSLKPTVAGAFRAIITLDGTLSSVDPAYSLSIVTQSYANQMDKGTMIRERLSKAKGQLTDYIPKLLELPLLKNNQITIARADEGGWNHLVATLTISLFTSICMVVMLTSLFVQGELMRFVLAPLSISGFGVGMLMLIVSVIRQLKPKV